ncbi:MAG: ATP-binding protein [Cyclobacteriaceae bacterium]
MIQRTISNQLLAKFKSGKVIFLIGPRQVGKTTLINSILKGEEFLFLNGDDPTTRKLLTNPNTEQIKGIIGRHTLVFVDEAQRIENIGITLKLITDQLDNVQLIVSGSSAFELSNQTNEPLTGRKWEFKLYPISWQEFQDHVGYLKAEQQLEQRLIYGMYPDVINHLGSEVEVLKNLSDSYLFKDILAFSGIRKPQVLEKLLMALALQVGSEVSYNELAQTVGVDKNTISSYITILEQTYVIFRLSSFSRNLRSEIRTNQKIYFVDNGVRNAIIGNFDPLEVRNDRGMLWENFLISERRKKLTYSGSLAKHYFWRTKQQQEVDYVEAEATRLNAYEFKWNPNARAKIPKLFEATYETNVVTIHNENFRDFIF